MKRRPTFFQVSDITPLLGLWPEYYGQETVNQATREITGKRVGKKKAPCTEEELKAFLNGGPMSKTRRLELFRALMRRLGTLRALLSHRHRKERLRYLDEKIAIGLATRQGRSLASHLRDLRR